MAEYRLEEMARLSGVSTRNIRAYRERGLLDAPRREGRSAFYNDGHLAQLHTIDRLLRRGFNSAHIAEFFAAVRDGRDLADVLELDRDVLDPDPGRVREAAPPKVLDIDPSGVEAGRLVDYGLARRVRDGIALTDPVLADVVQRSPVPQVAYVRVLLQVFESVRETLDRLAADVGNGRGAAAPPGHEAPTHRAVGVELFWVLGDYRDLVSRVVSRCLDEVSARLPTARPQP
ncbi:MerR family transcriptional regulator [Mycolicibacterium thermoresistibile]